MPARSTVSLWAQINPKFSDQLTRAMKAGSHALVEIAREAAEDGSNDWMEKYGRDGQAIGWQINGEAVARSRLRVDHYWREAEAREPKVYARRSAVEHSGSITVVDGTDEEIMAELVELLATGRLKLPEGIKLVEVEEAEEDDFSDIA